MGGKLDDSKLVVCKWLRGEQSMVVLACFGLGFRESTIYEKESTIYEDRSWGVSAVSSLTQMRTSEVILNLAQLLRNIYFLEEPSL